MFEVDYLGSDIEVVVVVQDRQSVVSCQHGGQQVGDVYRSVPPCPSQDALRIERTLPVIIVSRQMLVRLAAARTCSYSPWPRALYNASASRVAQVATRPPVMSGSSRSAAAANRIRAAALVSMRNRAITPHVSSLTRVRHRLHPTFPKPGHLPGAFSCVRGLAQGGADRVRYPGGIQLRLGERQQLVIEVDQTLRHRQSPISGYIRGPAAHHTNPRIGDRSPAPSYSRAPPP